jgi:hypothetical protein
MAVQRTCTVDKGTVIVAVSAGEFLEYRVPSASPGAEYQVVDDDLTIILGSADCAPPCIRRWPTEPVAPGVRDHTLALQFFDDQSVSYEVDHMDAHGAIVQEVKRCRYENRGGPDDFFDALEVIVR